MDGSLQFLLVDPLPCLLSADDKALRYFVHRDLLTEPFGPIESLWELPTASEIVRKQQADGSWRYPGKGQDSDSFTNYSLLETFKNLRVLVEMYGFNNTHPALQAAASYIYSCQTDEGDIRGILGNQHMPYYHGAIMELLIKAGCQDDVHIKEGMEWLLSVQQSDGGWLIPAQAIPAREKTEKMWRGEPITVERSQPSSHLATGMVLRAFAAHPGYRHLEQVRRGGELMKSRFFQPDRYNDRKSAQYWLKFQYPFWWSNLLTVLDSLSMLGFPLSDTEIQSGLDWFIKNQAQDGLWPTLYDKGRKAGPARMWVSLAICRVFKKFYGCL